MHGESGGGCSAFQSGARCAVVARRVVGAVDRTRRGARAVRRLAPPKASSSERLAGMRHVVDAARPSRPARLASRLHFFRRNDPPCPPVRYRRPGAAETAASGHARRVPVAPGRGSRPAMPPRYTVTQARQAFGDQGPRRLRALRAVARRVQACGRAAFPVSLPSSAPRSVRPRARKIFCRSGVACDATKLHSRNPCRSAS